MEMEETTLSVIESTDENNAKKGKFMTLLFPSEAVPAEGKDSKKDKNKPLTKVVVRRLPPRLTKEAFLEEFSPLPANDYFYFVRGDLSLGSHSFSRAYINFVNQDDIFTFKEKYDDYGVQDDKGKTYHAVVEFAPFQRIPRRNALKKKLSKAGTLESDPKYLDFLKKLEEYKNNVSNTSEYFHETENTSLKVKITTTPLLEYLKAKKQKKNEMKNDLRARKRDLEKERKRKEEEKRKAERERRKEDKKNSRYDEKNRVGDEKSRKSDERLKDIKRNEIRGRTIKEEKKDSKKDVEGHTVADDKSEVVIPSDPAILQVVIRQPEKSGDKGSKSNNKILSASNEDNIPVKSLDGDSGTTKSEKKYSDFRTRLAEEKQRKTFHKRDSEESKTLKTSSRSRKGVPDERGDNYSVGNCSDGREYGKVDMDGSKNSKNDQKGAKSKFRYSEQRNRDREYRSQKTSDWKKEGLSIKPKGKENKEKENEKDAEVSKSNMDESQKDKENNSDVLDKIAVKIRRRSLELEKKSVEVRKRSRSFHDISSKRVSDFRLGKKNKTEGNGTECEAVEDASKENNELDKGEEDNKKNARAERRIRNKDRPSLEIYRPGMGKFSKQRLEQKKDEINPSSTPNSVKNSRISNKSNNKKPSVEHKTQSRGEKIEEPAGKNSATPAKTPSEVRTMTFTRSGSKEN